MTHSDSVLLHESAVGATTTRPAVPDERVLSRLCDGLAEALRVTPRSPQRISVRLGEASIDVEWPSGPVTTIGSPEPVATDEHPDNDTGARPFGHAVSAPLVGTFYQAPEPGAQPFVQVGDRVAAGQQVAIVEAMKLMNSVEADVSGTVVDVLVTDGEAVEYGRPLILIDPEEQA